MLLVQVGLWMVTISVLQVVMLVMLVIMVMLVQVVMLVMLVMMGLVQVVDRLSGQPVCGPDTQGELCVRTPQLLLSYRYGMVWYGMVRIPKLILF